MHRDKIHTLLNRLRVEQISDRPQWVSSTCPFVHWTHERKTNLRNSFGISVGESSVFHCFSCGKTGALMNLPNMLFLLSGRDPTQLRRFIYMNEHVELATSTISNLYDPENAKLTPIPQEEIERRFDPLCPYRSMTVETIKEWGLKYDPDRRRLVIPIKNNKNQVIALKGRALRKGDEPKYYLYTEFNPRDPKSSGVWFGMHYPLVPSKALLLVEGEIDCILVKQTGLVQNVWGIMGVGVTLQQISTLANISNPIIFFFDNDKAGHDLKERLHKTLKGLSPHYEITNYGRHKDAGDAVAGNELGKILASVQKKP